MVNTSNNVFVCVEYKTNNAIETSFTLDLDTWTSIKNNEVSLLLDDIILQVKVGKVTHKCKSLADPTRNLETYNCARIVTGKQIGRAHV